MDSRAIYYSYTQIPLELSASIQGMTVFVIFHKSKFTICFQKIKNVSLLEDKLNKINILKK